MSKNRTHHVMVKVDLNHFSWIRRWFLSKDDFVLWCYGVILALVSIKAVLWLIGLLLMFLAYISDH